MGFLGGPESDEAAAPPAFLRPAAFSLSSSSMVITFLAGAFGRKGGGGPLGLPLAGPLPDGGAGGPRPDGAGGLGTFPEGAAGTPLGAGALGTGALGAGALGAGALGAGALGAGAIGPPLGALGGWVGAAVEVVAGAGFALPVRFIILGAL